MKKVLFYFVLIFLCTFILPVKVNVYEDKKFIHNKIISIDKIYSSWDDAKKAGEYIYDIHFGKLKFNSAYRIGTTEKFKVTYIRAIAELD